MNTELRLGIDGMSCASCVGRVEQALQEQVGVETATVNLANNIATVSFDQLEIPTLLHAIREAGYEPVVESLSIPVAGMSCASCVSRVERALVSLPGIVDASVNLATERADLHYLPASVSPSRIRQTIRDAGYEPGDEAADEQSDQREREENALLSELRFATVFVVPLIIIAMGPMLLPSLAENMNRLWGHTGWGITEWLLATPVQFWAGRRFYRLGWAELKHASPGMNSLVMIGSSAAYLYSVAAILVPHWFPKGTANLYFEAAAVIITLILLGKYFEARAKGRTSQAVKRLLDLQVKTARVIRDASEIELNVEALVPGDVIAIRAGERVAVDGVVTEGNTWVDESMISGEPVPVEKKAGDELVGGTINQTASIQYRATRVGADTVLAQIIQMVEQAQASKPPIQRLADRIAGIFVPVVLVLSALTFIGWFLYGPEPSLNYAFVAAVSVLLIACPCAMGLATPTAVMVATGKAAELGTLFRQGSALETLAHVDTVVLDKTGTLTEGRPVLTALSVVKGDENHALAVAAAVERETDHPIARAIVAAAADRNLTIPRAEQASVEAGFGISSMVNGQNILVGADRFLEQRDIDLAPAKSAAMDYAEAAQTTVWLAIDDELAAVFAVSDPVKPESVDALEALHRLGISTAMLTGDNPQTAHAVARDVGIDQVFAGVLPDGKALEVSRLRHEGARLAFVGDGINDAPALASANVGIAIGTGTDIAVEAGDVVLMSGDLRGIVSAITLSRRTLGIIRGNFFWAYAYNVALIPVAAGILYPWFGVLLNPMLAAAAMSVSSLFVVSNSLRLKRHS